MSPNGWMDSEMFNRWFEQHFLCYIPATRPIILLQSYLDYPDSVGQTQLFVYLYNPNCLDNENDGNIAGVVYQNMCSSFFQYSVHV